MLKIQKNVSPIEMMKLVLQMLLLMLLLLTQKIPGIIK